jgi:hypothetical protein
MPRRFTSLILVALTALPVCAASSVEVERQIGTLVTRRTQLRTEREGLLRVATVLAGQIEPAKRGSETTRAGGRLTQDLQLFDRLASHLDEVEQRLTQNERELHRLLSRFDEAFAREEHDLELRGSGGTAELAALTQRRDRLAPLRENRGFRPPLDVAIEPSDGPIELEGRIAIIDGERTRIAGRIVQIDAERALVSTRLRAKRQLARELGLARREAGGSVELVDQAHESAEAAVRALGERVEALARERSALEKADAELAGRRREAEARLTLLGGAR